MRFAGGSASGGAAAALAGTAIVLVAAALAVHAASVLPSTDDFCNRLNATAEPLGEALRTIYMGWSGRLVTSALLYASFANLDLPQFVSVGFALVALFVACALVFARIAAMDSEHLRLPAAATALVILTLGLYPLLGQVVFWATGGIVYLVPLILLLAWLHSLRRLVFDADPGYGAAAGFGFGVLVGNSIELVLPIVFLHGGVVLAKCWRRMGQDARAIAAWRFAGVITGASVLLLAPGNVVRAGATPGSFDLDPAHLASAFAHMLKEVMTGAGAIALAVMLLLGVAAVARMRRPPGSQILSAGPAAVPLAESAALAAGGLASLLPLLAAPVQFAPRNGLYLLVSLLLAAAMLALPLIARWRRGPLALTLVALAGSVYVTGFLTPDVEAARALRVQLADRDQRLRDAAAAGTREVVVPAIALLPPRTVHWIELSSEPSRWDNRCMARYHGLDSVRVTPVQR